MKGAINAGNSWAGCWAFVVAALISWAVPNCTHAQLAITEVMAGDTLNEMRVPGADFWELTNFGTNAIDLTDLSFTDSDHEPSPLPSQGLWIGPGESILFIQTNATMTETLFREWWNLAPDYPVVRSFGEPGLSSKRDSVRIFDAVGQLIDRVDFGLSLMGHSFTYETNGPNSGGLSVITFTGMCQAVEARAGSVGSPGTTCGPLPLQIWQQPTNLVVTAGMDAEFVARTSGMPRPKHQWLRNDSPIPGATGCGLVTSLIISNAQPADAGTYQVLVTNGLENLLSASATLTVLTNPSAPYFVSRPSDQLVFIGQTARFRSVVAGYPPPKLQWSCSGADLLDEANRVLVIPGSTLGMSGSVYCLTASNEWGSINACAVLTVTEKPYLRITENLARRRSNEPKYRDWFELTNYGTNSVDLQGYRYGQVDRLDDAWIVDVPVVIKPGESVIFADVLTRDQFVEWWGPDNLPEDLQVITWTGFGISSEGGEKLSLWGPNTEDPSDTVDRVFTDVFIDGVSKYYEDSAECWLGCDSVPGERGAFFAVNGGEIGSPGYVSNPPLNLVGVQLESGEVLLKGRSIVGRSYALLRTTNLALPPSSWEQLGTQAARNATVYFRDVRGTGSRFYRLEQLP